MPTDKSNWTEDRDNLLRVMLGNGHSYREIGDRLSISRSSVSGRASRLGITGTSKKAKSWTSQRTDKLASMLGFGKTFKECAAELGMPEGSCGTQAKRMGLRSDRRPGQNVIMAGRDFRPRSDTIKTDHRKQVIADRGPEPKALGGDLITEIGSGCRFAHGEGPYVFCGHDQKHGSPYCDWHHALCRVKPWKRQMSRHRDILEAAQ